MKYLAHGIIFIVLLCFFETIGAQSREIVFRRFSVSDGLPNNSVLAVYFDSKGFLWVGTEEGLARFDGEDFVIYNYFSTHGKLTGNAIRDIVEDKEGWLWIATLGGGIFRFNPATNEVFSPVLPAFGGSEQMMTYCLWLSPRGGMVVGTDKGIYLSEDRKMFKLSNDSSNTACYAIKEYGGKAYTAETRGGSREISEDLTFSETCELSYGNFLNTIFIDSKGTSWTSTWEGELRACHMATSTFLRFNLHEKLKSEIVSITELYNGKLWLALKSGQLWEFDKNSYAVSQVHITEQGFGKLYGTRIQCLYTDKYGRTWVGTNNGLHLHSVFTSPFSITYLGEEKSVVRDIKRVNNHLLLACSDGVYSDDNSKLIEDKAIDAYSLMEGEDGCVFIGTSSSILCYDMTKKRITTPLKQSSSTFQVNNIGASRYNVLMRVKSKSGDYFLAQPYGYGLVRFEKEFEWSVFCFTSKDGVENLLNGMYQSSDGRLWALGSLTGVLECDADSLTSTHEATLFSPKYVNVYNEGLLSKNTTALVELSDKSLWVSTLGGGLYRFYPGNTEKPFSLVSSPSQSIISMIADNNDNLWMTTSGVLLSFSPKSGKWKKYNERDGIPPEGLSGSLYKDNNGEIYVGGNGFFLHFNPDDMLSIQEIPHTTITTLRTIDWSGSYESLEGGRVQLPHGNNYLKINFSSLCFTNADAATFRYRLDGVDEEWHENGTLNTISYNALPSGKYVFRVKATSAEGLEDPEAASLEVMVAYPIYASWWFILLSIAFVGGVLWFNVRTYLSRRRELSLVRNKIARDLHDDIGSALGSISFFSETAKKIIVQDTDKTVEVLDKIGSTSREMIENMHDIVWSVNPANDSFESVVLRMKNFSSDLCAANNVVLQFQVQDGMSSEKLSMTERKNLFLVFKESLYNSIKYSGCTEINVNIRHTAQKQIQMVISDNGSGFDVGAMGLGNGLKNMRTRAKEIEAHFEINSILGQGTSITIKLKS